MPAINSGIYLLPTKNLVTFVFDIKTEKIVDTIKENMKLMSTKATGGTTPLNQPIEK